MEDKKVNTYNPDEITGKNKDNKSGFKKGMLIFLGVVVVVVILGVSCNMGIKNLGISASSSNNEDYTFNSNYIGVLKIEGTISEDSSSSVLSDTLTYDHNWTLDRIEEMINDDNNKGLILFVNSPGGSVYASDELYYEILKYKKTGRPIYSAMGSMAASGGYYISAPCDKIIANRNCWTGSIGVTIGTVYDFSELLSKYGVKTVTITSGVNKAMGSEVNPLTAEQKHIFQGLVDESYEQFVGIVSAGRNMTKKDVKKLADGRVYTAKQAKANGLIDKIGTLDYAINDMKSSYSLNDCDVQEIAKSEDTTIFSKLLGKIDILTEAASSNSNYDKLVSLMGESNKFTITYLSNIEK